MRQPRPQFHQRQTEAALQAIEIQLNESPDKRVSLTDPDARSMMTRGIGIVGYNVQTAVDTLHHLIVAREVTHVGSDRDQLSSIAKQARKTIASETLSVAVDRSYRLIAHRENPIFTCE